MIHNNNWTSYKILFKLQENFIAQISVLNALEWRNFKRNWLLTNKLNGNFEEKFVLTYKIVSKSIYKTEWPKLKFLIKATIENLK